MSTGENVKIICVQELRNGEETERLPFDYSFGRCEMCFDLRKEVNNLKRTAFIVHWQNIRNRGFCTE